MALLDEPNIFAGPITRLQKVFNNSRTARENTYVAAMNEHEIRSIFEIASVESQSHRRCRIVQVMPEILSKPSRVVISALSIGGFLPPEADVLPSLGGETKSLQAEYVGHFLWYSTGASIGPRQVVPG